VAPGRTGNEPLAEVVSMLIRSRSTRLESRRRGPPPGVVLGFLAEPSMLGHEDPPLERLEG
jgi:hypothetical protein